MRSRSAQDESLLVLCFPEVENVVADRIATIDWLIAAAIDPRATVKASLKPETALPQRCNDAAVSPGATGLDRLQRLCGVRITDRADEQKAG